jgi:hypothetical protein
MDDKTLLLYTLNTSCLKATGAPASISVPAVTTQKA